MIKEKVERSIKNKINKKDWYKDLEKYELEKSIEWEIAIVKKLINFQLL